VSFDNAFLCEIADSGAWRTVNIADRIAVAP
jgi:hypothetical protein